MYSNKLVACIKANNKVLREDKENVYLPFGAEYSILIKNLNTVKALVSVSIDGTNATEDTQLVIAPNSEIELQRFIKNGNLDSGNAFKFIERSGSIEEFRGSKVDDGFIRIEFQFEKAKPVTITTHHYNRYHDWHSTWPGPYWYSTHASGSSGLMGDSLTGSSGGMMTNNNIGSVYGGAQATSAGDPAKLTSRSITRSASKSLLSSQTSTQSLSATPVNDIGITVAGSEVKQQFKVASAFAVEDQKHVLILKLVGEVGNVQVTAPVTVSAKPKCTTCGRTNKANAKFCVNCGTSLSII